MIFKQVLLENNIVYARAEGHATDVMERFREIAGALLGNQGAWRITYVHGECDKFTDLESNMIWELIAQNKADMAKMTIPIYTFPHIQIRLS